MKRVLIVILVGVAVIGGWVVHLLWSAGQFKTIVPHFAGSYRPVFGVVGAEDITIHPITGIAYISACDRRALKSGKNGKGGIYYYDLNAKQPEPVKLTDGPGPDFQPHGISLYVDPEGQDALFVINHSGGTHKIEIYDLKENSLIHRQTVKGQALISPNDLVAVSRDKFYASNDHHYTKGILKTFEDYLKLPIANVVYYDGKSFHEAATGIGYPNGINVSSNSSELYVVGTTQMVLNIYDRDKVSGKLTFKNQIDFDTGLDNIEIGPNGELWIGAHPQLLKFVAHAKNPANLSPSQILRVKLNKNGTNQIDEVYLNDGSEISGSSVGAVYRNRLLIGSVFEEKFLDCRLKD